MSVSEAGYEQFSPEDQVVISWLSEELRVVLLRDDNLPSRQCYHLKGNGGITQATADLHQLIGSDKYPFVIRSDAKGYYAHIRHHLLLNVLRELQYSNEVCDVTQQLCQRMTVRGGVYQECTQGIPLGCCASPLIAALYLNPLDEAMVALPGVKYLRYMDDWVILCKSRWTMRKAVKLMHQTLATLGQHAHPEKTYIGRVSKGFDFLGVQYHPHHQESQTVSVSPSHVSKKRLAKKLSTQLNHASQLYEQGKLYSLERLEGYLNNWLRWAKGIGVSALTALHALSDTLHSLSTQIHDLMEHYFLSQLIQGVNKRTTQTINYEIKKYPGRSRSLSVNVCSCAGRPCA